MKAYYVVTEDGDSMGVDASSPQAAADHAMAEWQMEADLGYRLHVFEATDAKEFKVAQHVEPIGAEN